MKRVLQIEMLDGKALAAPLMAGSGLGSKAIVRDRFETPHFNRDGTLVILNHCQLLRSQAEKSSSGEDPCLCRCCWGYTKVIGCWRQMEMIVISRLRDWEL